MLKLKEDFETFSHSCPYREMKTTGDTGWHNCTKMLKIQLCGIKICPRVITQKRKTKATEQI